jgi:signal transduction histidine kinase
LCLRFGLRELRSGAVPPITVLMATVLPPPSSQDFVAFAIAHEVRNLLTPAKAYADLGDTSAASRAIETVLEFAEAVLNSQCQGECDLREVAERSVASLGPQTAVFHVELERGIRVPMPGPLLERVLGNLLLNSVQAMGQRGGEVTIGCFTWNGRHRIQVTDTGPGRKSPATAARGRGLQICAFLLEQCGATLDLEQTAGIGTTATIDLPVAASAARAA